MSQLAQLHLRGSLCTQTMKNLTTDQKGAIDDIIEMVVRDPDLQGCKHKFCSVLGSTIKNEYAHKDVAMQDYRIAIMRAAVAAKFGWGRHEPVEEAINDPKQRKKWFQTWAFKYMKQILRENKIPGYKQVQTVCLPADQAAVQEIKSIIKNAVSTLKDPQEKQRLKHAYSKMEVREVDAAYKIMVDQWTFPAELVYELAELAEQYLSHDVEIMPEPDCIVINPLDSVLPGVEIQESKDIYVTFLNFESRQDDDEGDGFRYQLEYEISGSGIMPDSGPIDNDMIIVLRERLPAEAAEVLDVIVDTPREYLDRFGNGPIRKTHLAEFLDKSPREVGRILQIIKVNAMALGIGL